MSAGKASSKTATGKGRAAVDQHAGAQRKSKTAGAAVEPAGSVWEYAPAPESRDVVSIEPEYGLFVAGEFRPAADGRTFATIDPATEEPLAQVAAAGPADVDAAVAAARSAQEQVWGPMPGSERAKYLYRIARQLQERAREFAVLESIDNGKPIKESRDVDIPLAAAHFFYYAGWADKLAYAGFGPDPRPLGVAGQVIPWNFPLLMAAWKLAPALAAGNTCVLKPAETTPLTALLLAQICQQAGLPAGVVNVVTGAGDTGAALVSHPGVNKVAFTGSTEVGKEIARAVAGTGKKLTLELGGKAANIVFDDAPIEQAVEGIVNGIFFNQGHVCCAGSRLLVQESVADAVVERLQRRLGTLRLGDPLDKNTDIGAINSAQQLAKISELTKAGEAEGAQRWSPPCQLPDRGYWFPPTVFTGVAQSHRIAREEIFGPVLSVLTFRTPDEAVAKANNTPYGLSAGVWTDKGSRILWLAQQLRAGVIWANTYNRFDPASPFGGYQESGYGREGGRHGLAAYLDV
jgi:aldehyde dehydrogenase (NAD+)